MLDELSATSDGARNRFSSSHAAAPKVGTAWLLWRCHGDEQWTGLRHQYNSSHQNPQAAVWSDHGVAPRAVIVLEPQSMADRLERNRSIRGEIFGFVPKLCYN